MSSDPERLCQVRGAPPGFEGPVSLAQCGYELRQVEQLYRRRNVPFVNSANMSIEEIAATVIQEVLACGAGASAGVMVP